MTGPGDTDSATAAELWAEDLAAAGYILARRFALGATMWCVAPRWPSHGRHVAVEFVHPVIVGKRALPAMTVEGGDVTATLRLLVRPGDVLLALGPAEEALEGLLRRAEAWGLTTLWIGAGPRPQPGSAAHVIWVDDTDVAIAARSGDVVLRYHLLWELTQVVLEHPGLLVPEAACLDEVCITCSDEGRVVEVGRVLSDGRAEVIAGGRVETVDVSLVDPVRPGDLVLVHAGMALTSLLSAPSEEKSAS